MGDQTTDADLLARTAAGEIAAFQTFHQRHAGRVLSYARKIARAPDLAEDITQEVFLAVWRKAGTYRPDRGDVLGWLYTLTRNKVMDAWRRPEHRAGHAPLPGDAEHAEPAAPRRPAGRTGEMRILFSQALGRLKPEQREAIQLAYFEDLTYEETAGTLDLPVGTLKSRIRAALRALRELLEPLPLPS
jgi:RNA polymerase sigma-70 factor (ECF subfamily)